MEHDGGNGKDEIDGSGEVAKQGDDWMAMGADTGGGPWVAEMDAEANVGLMEGEGGRETDADTGDTGVGGRTSREVDTMEEEADEGG